MYKTLGGCENNFQILENFDILTLNCYYYFERGYTGKGVVVTILDDGIQPNHPELVRNFVIIFKDDLYSDIISYFS